MGDVVLTTPAIKALRQAYPHARITFLVTPQTKALIEKNPYLNEVLVDDRRGAHKGLFGFFNLVSSLRAKKFDLAVVFHTKKRTNLLSALAGIPYRIGYKNNKLGFFLTHPIVDKRHEGIKHEAEYCLDVLRELGIESNDLELHVSLTKESEEWFNQFRRQHGLTAQDRLVAVHPGASDPARRWPPYYFAEVVEALINKYSCKVILVGSEDIKSLSQQINPKENPQIIDTLGKTSLSQLASLLSHCHLLISNDTGPVHVAAGVGTAVLSIFTRNQPGINPERWRPLGKRSRFVSVPVNQDISFLKAGPTDPQYLELIKPQQVLEEVDAIFKLC